jgi:hypothetical protein
MMVLSLLELVVLLAAEEARSRAPPSVWSFTRKAKDTSVKAPLARLGAMAVDATISTTDAGKRLGGYTTTAALSPERM